MFIFLAALFIIKLSKNAMFSVPKCYIVTLTLHGYITVTVTLELQCHANSIGSVLH